MPPSVILHNAMSLDGRITDFPADLELYYGLAARWNPDAVLFGSTTILQAPSLEVPPEHTAMFTPPPGQPDTRPLMVVVDSGGKVQCWEKLLTWPYFRGFVSLCSSSTPEAHREYLVRNGVSIITAGTGRVDLRTALGELERSHGVRVVRADSGGTLNSALLATGFVTEISVLVHPFMAGGDPVPGICDPVQAGTGMLQIPLALKSHEVLAGGIVWLRYAPQTPSLQP